MTLVNVFDQPVKPIQLIDDKFQAMGDLLFGLRGRKSALQGKFFGGFLQPLFVIQPLLRLVDNIAAITRNMVGRFQA